MKTGRIERKKATPDPSMGFAPTWISTIMRMTTPAMQSKALSATIVAKEDTGLISSFLPITYARTNSPMRAGRMEFTMKPMASELNRLECLASLSGSKMNFHRTALREVTMMTTRTSIRVKPSLGYCLRSCA